jgi:hypothetical protein
MALRIRSNLEKRLTSKTVPLAAKPVHSSKGLGAAGARRLGARLHCGGQIEEIGRPVSDRTPIEIRS